jgi:hypothetical protein
MNKKARREQIEEARKKAAEAHTRKRLEREAQGIYKAEFMRLTLTEDAYNIVKGLDGTDFRRFVSDAIRNHHKERYH